MNLKVNPSTGSATTYASAPSYSQLSEFPNADDKTWNSKHSFMAGLFKADRNNLKVHIEAFKNGEISSDIPSSVMTYITDHIKNPRDELFVRTIVSKTFREEDWTQRAEQTQATQAYLADFSERHKPLADVCAFAKERFTACAKPPVTVGVPSKKSFDPDEITSRLKSDPAYARTAKVRNVFEFLHTGKAPNHYSMFVMMADEN